MVRIAMQHVFPHCIESRTSRYETLWQALAKYLQVHRADGLEIEQVFLAQGSENVYNLFLEHLNNTAIVRSCIDSEVNGFEGIALACFADPAVSEIRSAVNIPVIGAAEAGMLVAKTLGDRFACVAVSPRVVRMMERNLMLTGTGAWAIHNRPIRFLQGWNYEVLVDNFLGRSNLLIENFEIEAKQAIAEGADVIVSGCAYLAALLQQREYFEVPGTGIPVVDSLGAAIQLAASLARMWHVLGLKHSQGAFSIYKRAASSEVSDAVGRLCRQ